MLAGVITLAVSLLYVRSRFLAVELSYALTEKRSVLSKLEQEKRALTLELATLRTPARVERIARTKLGLRQHRAQERTVLVRNRDRP
jgi:cell division protein FtsL